MSYHSQESSDPSLLPSNYLYENQEDFFPLNYHIREATSTYPSSTEKSSPSENFFSNYTESLEAYCCDESDVQAVKEDTISSYSFNFASKDFGDVFKSINAFEGVLKKGQSVITVYNSSSTQASDPELEVIRESERVSFEFHSHEQSFRVGTLEPTIEEQEAVEDLYARLFPVGELVKNSKKIRKMLRKEPRPRTSRQSNDKKLHHDSVMRNAAALIVSRVRTSAYKALKGNLTKGYEYIREAIRRLALSDQDTSELLDFVNSKNFGISNRTYNGIMSKLTACRNSKVVKAFCLMVELFMMGDSEDYHAWVSMEKGEKVKGYIKDDEVRGNLVEKLRRNFETLDIFDE